MHDKVLLKSLIQTIRTPMRFLDPKNLNMISIDQQKGGCYIMMSVLSELPIQKSLRVMQTPYFQTS